MTDDRKPPVPDAIKEDIEHRAFDAAFAAFSELDVTDLVPHNAIVHALIAAVAAVNAFEKSVMPELKQHYDWMYLDTSQTVAAAYAAWLLGLKPEDNPQWSSNTHYAYKLTSFVVFSRLCAALSDAQDFADEGDESGISIYSATSLAKLFPKAFPLPEEGEQTP